MIAALILAATLSAGNAEFDDSAKSGARDIALARAKAELVAGGPPAGELRKAMLADPGRFAKADVAKELGRELCRRLVDAELDRRLAAVNARLGLAGTSSALTLSEADAAALTKAYDRRFAEERRAACAEQAETLAVRIRPTMAEADGEDDAALARTLAARIAESQAQPVFEENLAYISERMVRPIVEDARREKKRQREYVRRTRSDACAPSALAADLSGKLCANVKARAAEAENPALAWEVFPSVTNVTLAAAVATRVDERFADKVAEAPFAVSEQAIADAIAADRQAHRRAADSRRLTREAASARLLAAGRAKAVADAPEGERAELAACLDGRMGAKGVVAAVARRVDGVVEPAWSVARRKAVAAEFATVWPTLDDRTWYPPAELADEVSARSDAVAAVAGWRRLPALAELAQAGRDVLEETDAEADSRVRDAFELARAALAAQNRIVDSEMPSVLAESVRRKDGFWTRTPDFKAVVAMLTEATEKRWDETRLATLWPVAGAAPANAGEQHAALFPSVRRKIELVARQILEEMEKTPEPKEEKPETPPDDPSPSEEESEEELCTIVFETHGASVSVKATKGGRTVAERTGPATAAGFEQAVREVGAVVGREVLKLK